MEKESIKRIAEAIDKRLHDSISEKRVEIIMEQIYKVLNENNLS